MSNTQIRGNIDIVASTITDTEIASSANIATSKLADGANFILRGGTVAFTADQSMGGNKLTDLASPVAGTDAVNKDYADAIAAGLTPNAAAKVSTTTTLTLTTDYTRTGTGSSHVLTASGNGALSLDGVSSFTDVDNDGASANPFAASPASRVLVQHASDAKDNGIYAVKDKGSGGTPWKLIRATDFDGAPTNEVTGGDFVWVQAGTLYNGSQWTVVATGTVVVDTDNINWTQTNGTGSITASTGLIKVGNDIRLNITDLTADTIAAADELAFYDTSGSDVNKITFANFESSLALNNISGTLGVSKGGTGATTLTSNGVLYGNGTGAVQATAAGASGGILYSNSGTPAFTSNVFVNNGVPKFSTATGVGFTFEAGGAGTVRTLAQTAGSTNSGTLDLNSGAVSGATSNSGDVHLFSGASSTSGNTGVVNITTGDATSGNSGSITLGTGTASGTVGSITMSIGGTQIADVAADGLNIVTGTTYQINNTSVLSATTLGSSVVNSSLTSVGTIATGTWQGSVIGTLYGGTGLAINPTSIADGDLLIGSNSGDAFVRTTLTAGTGISITNGAGSITIATTGVITSSSIVTEEVPSGTINGVNDTFTLANTPIAGTVRVYLRGLRRKSGPGNDYTISGTTLTMITIPQTGDAFFIDYFK
jgi:hypothetical protein